MGGLNRMNNRQAEADRVRERLLNARPQRRPAREGDERSEHSGHSGDRGMSEAERRRWLEIAVALAAMTAVVGVSSWLVLGTRWLGLAMGACVAALALAAWYSVSGRTIGMNGDVRERVLERHYIGVAWYASMLRNTRERGGYERGLRRELTRLAAARMAERHGVNLYRDPHTAARIIGTDLWPLVDPAAAKTTGGRPGAVPPEVPLRAVAELIERLERM